MKIEAVKNLGIAIEYIENPSKEVQLEAVKQNGYAIEYIENPSKEVQLAAVRENGYAIQYIKTPLEEVMYEAILHADDIIALKYILNRKNINWDKISDETKLLLEIKEF